MVSPQTSAAGRHWCPSLPFGGFVTSWGGCPRGFRPVVPPQKANISKTAFPSRGCALRTPRSCRFGKHPGYHRHRWLWWWHPPRCKWALHGTDTHSTHPVGNGGCCVPHSAYVQSAFCSLPGAEPMGQGWGPWEERNPREFGSKSDIVNNGGKQLIRNLFHCVILKSFVMCVCADFSSFHECS